MLRISVRRGRRLLFGMSVVATAQLTVVACESPAEPGGPAADASTREAGDDQAAVDGPGPDSSDAAVQCVLPGSYGSPTCNECMKRQCCSLIEACERETGCKSLQRCLLECIPKPDAGGCYDDCVGKHPSALEAWHTVEACWFEDPPSCGVECT